MRVTGLLCCCLLLSGCHQHVSKADKHAKATAYEPSVELTSGDLGLDFMPGATSVMSARCKRLDGSIAKKVQLLSDDSVASVYHFYRRRLQPPLITDLLTGDGPAQQAELSKSLGRDRLDVTAFVRKERTVILLERVEAPPPDDGKAPKKSRPTPAAKP